MWRRLFYCASLVLAFVAQAIADDDLRQRLKDANAEQSDLWIYNDIQQAMDEAKKQGKPLFVTFSLRTLQSLRLPLMQTSPMATIECRGLCWRKRKFICVRQVEMKGVDLSLFQFDYDLNWAAMFISHDGVVYARYGTQSSEGPDAYNSIDGLLETMKRVLELHIQFPGNDEELKGKRGNPKRVAEALKLPGLRNANKYAEQTTRQNCIHCHNIHDAEHQFAVDNGTYSHELLWKYPLPDNMGIKIDRNSGVRISSIIDGSAAQRAGLREGDEVSRMNGQRIVSIADMQWVLHHLPNTATKVVVETRDSRKCTVSMEPGWKRYDFSWRASMWNAAPRLQVWTPPLSAESKAKLGLPESESAFEMRWINRESAGGRRAFDDGLREKDIVIAIAGKPFEGNSNQFHAHIKLNYKIGDDLPLTVLRDGRRETVKIRLVE